MILVLGAPTDRCVQATLRELARRAAAVSFVPEAELRTALGVNWLLTDTGHEGYLSVNSRRLPLEDLNAVLVRLGSPTAWASSPDEAEQRYLQSELAAVLYGLLQAIPCPVINRLRPEGGYRLTFANRTLITALQSTGFVLPPSLVTANGDTAREFYESQGRRVLTGLPVFGRPTLLAGEQGRDALPAEGRRPLFLQAVPAGRWLRVFVVGGQTFTAEIRPASLTAGAERTPARTVEPPAGLADRCRLLADHLDLGCFEMLVVCGEDGHDHCFALSDLPWDDGWEEPLRRRIASALADLLIRPAQRSAA